jgi:hypothetical protein
VLLVVVVVVVVVVVAAAVVTGFVVVVAVARWLSAETTEHTTDHEPRAVSLSLSPSLPLSATRLEYSAQLLLVLLRLLQLKPHSQLSFALLLFLSSLVAAAAAVAVAAIRCVVLLPLAVLLVRRDLVPAAKDGPQRETQ